MMSSLSVALWGRVQLFVRHLGMNETLKKPFVSVVVPVFNDRDRLYICLKALEEQSYPEDLYEVIVVDNGSDVDKKPTVAGFKHAILMEERRTGSYAARNRGLTIAKGDVIAFTDADCVPDKNWLANGVDCMQRSDNCGIVAGKIEIVIRNQAKPSSVELYEYAIALQQRKYVEEQRFAVTANVFTLKTVFDRVGTFNEKLKSGGDREWSQRVLAVGYGLVYTEHARVFHSARRTIRDLYKKVVRVTGGVYILRRYGLGAHFVKSGSERHGQRLESLGSSALEKIKAIYRNEEIGGIRNTMTILCIALLVILFARWEVLRLMLGGKPSRA